MGVYSFKADSAMCINQISWKQTWEVSKHGKFNFKKTKNKTESQKRVLERPRAIGTSVGYEGGVCAFHFVEIFHLVEIFAINEWKLKRSILNRLKYQTVNCEIKRSNCVMTL